MLYMIFSQPITCGDLDHL